MSLNDESALTCHLKFNDDLLDETSNGNDATLVGSPTAGTAFTDGEHDEGVYRDTDGSITITHDSTISGTTFSIAGFVRIKLNADASHRIFTKHVDLTHMQFTVYVTLAGPNRLNMQVGGSAGTVNTSSSASDVLTVDQYDHVAMTCDGTSFSGYLNGELVIGPTTIPTNYIAANTEDLILGGSNTMESDFDDFRYYDRELTASEVYTLATAAYGKVNLNNDSSLMCHLKLDDDLLDASGNNNFLRLTSTPAEADAFVSGKFGGGITRDVVGSAYVVHSNDISGTVFTVAFWCKTSSWPTGNLHRICAKYDGSTTKQFAIYIDNSPAGAIAVVTKGAVNWSEFYSTNTMSLNTWHHVALTCSGASGRMGLYLDGIKEYNATLDAEVVENTSNIYFNNGTEDTAPTEFDDFRYYDRVLRQSEITTLATDPYVHLDNDPNLVCHLKFDDDLTDSSSEGTDNPCILDGLPAIETAFVAGKYNHGFYRSINGGAHIAHHEDITGTEFTVALWAKRDDASTADALARKYDSSLTRQFCIFAQATGKHSYATRLDGSNDVDKGGTYVCAAGEWCHVAMRVTEDYLMRGFVNGVADCAETDVTGKISTDTNALYLVNGGSIGWTIDDFRYYDRALSDDEIYDLYRITYSTNKKKKFYLTGV